MFRGRLLSFSLCLLPLVLSVDTTEKYLAPYFSHHPIWYLYTMTRSLPSLEPFLLQSRQPESSQPLLVRQMLQVLNHLCDSSLDSMQYVYISLVLGIPGPYTTFLTYPHQCWIEGKDLSFPLSLILQLLCQGPSEQQHKHMVLQPLLPVLDHLQTCFSALCPSIQIITEDFKMYWTQY